MADPRVSDRQPLTIRSALAGVTWPAVPAVESAGLLALEYQLEQSQWWPAGKLEAAQHRQLAELLRHAAATVPFYAERLRAVPLDPGRSIDVAAFRRLPFLTRRDIQSSGAALLSSAAPPDHGTTVEHVSGGSTGEPVCVIDTELSTRFWHAQTLRDHLWHRRDLAGRLCVIRSRVEDRTLLDWGPPAAAVFATGPGALLNIRAGIDRQLEWLREKDADYLLSHPTNIRELALESLKRGLRLPRLKEVHTFGESLPAGLRKVCNAAWGVPVTDTYGAEEVGQIAIQCPDHEHYHVQSENLLVEVLDDAGEPCAPGATGQVVITTLHNFAMPLIRYAIGDHAEVGAPCPCGRGLPVLTRIHGRTRNMLVLPDGRRVWPSTPYFRYAGVAPIRRIQIIQRARDAVEAHFVPERALTADEQRNMITAIQDGLGYPLNVSLRPVSEIPRPASMKFEDFKCELAGDETASEPAKAERGETGGADVEIRKMQPADLPQVLELLRHWNLAPMAPSAEIPYPERTGLIVENTSVAVADGRVVGVGSFIPLSATEAEGASFAVAPEYRDRNVGSLLVVAGRREMHARGIRKVYSETDRPENVRWLVKRFGYRVIGTVPKRHAFGNPQVDHWTRLVADLEPPFEAGD